LPPVARAANACQARWGCPCPRSPCSGPCLWLLSQRSGRSRSSASRMGGLDAGNAMDVSSSMCTRTRGLIGFLREALKRGLPGERLIQRERLDAGIAGARLWMEGHKERLWRRRSVTAGMCSHTWEKRSKRSSSVLPFAFRRRRARNQPQSALEPPPRHLPHHRGNHRLGFCARRRGSNGFTNGMAVG
jgi:hypothetical protein